MSEVENTNIGPEGNTVNQKSATGRCLNEEELKMLEKQNDRIVSKFKQDKLEAEAKKNWDLFYKRNTTKFFRDRHWTTREFEDLADLKLSGKQLKILEVGCGVGNFMFPLLEEIFDVFFYACDFSPRAVQYVKENPVYDQSRCHAFCCDLTTDDLTATISPGSLDLVSMIFVLSAIHPDKMVTVLRNIHSVLRSGGSILFRDYGLNDHAMIRFSTGSKLMDRFYVRQDSTRAYYFSTDELARLFTEAGFVPAKNDYILRETVNRKEGLAVPRVFVQGKFVKADTL